jgi:hypothetical protein
MDEAAAAGRKGFDEADDQVGMSNRIGPLVDYYFDHGRRDQALLVAQRAAAVDSECGLLTYFHLLEKLGRLTDAADCAHDIFTRYGEHTALDQLYAAHSDFFHDQNGILVQGLFPRGLLKVDLSHFTAAPSAGCKITGNSETLLESGLRPNDVIVAVDGYLVENARQFGYVSALKNDPHIEIIVWRNSRYMTAHTSAPGRDFGVTLENYTPPKK